MRLLVALAVGTLTFLLFRKGYRNDRNAHRILSERGDAPNPPDNIDQFKLVSTAFAPGAFIPQTHACDGQDQSPPLKIIATPEGTQSLALMMEDPDSPMPPIFDHWLMWNIAADTTEISAGSVPEGAVQGNNTLKNAQYNGPCTPNGTHHYHFKLFALDTWLDLPEGASKQELEAAMKGHVIAKTEMVGRYRANSVTQKNLAMAVAASAVKP